MVSQGARGFAVVIAVAAAASVTSLRNGFVYDDLPAVQEDVRVHSLAHPARLLVMPYWSSYIRDRIYRPLTTASFAVDWAAGGGNPAIFHLANLLLHLTVCALVFALARRVLGAGPGALVAALWFAVHPVHVEVFANVVGRSELLAALGYLAAALAYLAESDAADRAPGGLRRGALALLVLAGAAVAYGGKEHALTLPAALLLADAWTAHRRGVRFARVFARHAVTWCGAVAIAVAYLAARTAIVGTAFGGGNVGAGLENLGIAGRAMVMAPALLVWARLLALPLRLSADYTPNAFTPSTALSPAHAAAALLVIGALFAAWALRRRAPGVLAGLAWFAVTASVAMNVLVPTGVLLAERVLYLPSVGVALVAGALWELLYMRAWPGGRRLTWTLTALALALLAARTLTRIPVWRDGERFYAALVHDAPDAYRTHWATGARAFEQHRPREGEQEFLNAIHIYQGDAAVLQELGEHYLNAGLWEPADRFLTVAWRVDSLRADAVVQAMLARLRLGRFDSAVALGDDALRRFPNATTILMAMGDANYGLGRPVRALTYRRRMVYAGPRTWQNQHIAAEGAARAGRCEEARWRIGRALALAPSDAEAPRRLQAMLGDGPRCGLVP